MGAFLIFWEIRQVAEKRGVNDSGSVIEGASKGEIGFSH